MKRWVLVLGFGLVGCGHKPAAAPVDKPTPGDADGDGLANASDQCTQYPEDHDGFQDDDGCPEQDNDGDGVRDFQDECPDDPACGAKEGVEVIPPDDPPPDEPTGADTDGDGLPDDVQDQCNEEPEDFDGAFDDDGCPDYDNDEDGIADPDDACPDTPEDGGGATPDDGCPE